MQFHFISGLPRSGSTLLASLLRQNPDFIASIMTPTGRVITEALQAMGTQNEAHRFLDDIKKQNILRGIFEGYYRDSNAKVVFDNNRRWTNNLALTADLFPDLKVICCVRSVVEIVNSFEKLFRKYPLSLSTIYRGMANTTVYNRVKAIMEPDGVVGFAYSALKDAYYGPHNSRIIIIPFEALCKIPMTVMENLHTVLGYPSFGYDTQIIEQIPGAKEFDEQLGAPGLHDLRPTISYSLEPIILPPDIIAALPKPFWIKEEATVTG